MEMVADDDQSGNCSVGHPLRSSPLCAGFRVAPGNDLQFRRPCRATVCSPTPSIETVGRLGQILRCVILVHADLLENFFAQIEANPGETPFGQDKAKVDRWDRVGHLT